MPVTKIKHMSRHEVMSLIASDLSHVEKTIGVDTVCSIDAVTEINRHLQNGGGKRLRPVLLLLAAGACGERSDAAIRLGAVVEIIHTATLVHDDVIDGADVRRGLPSTNRQWGNQTSVLAGDWLYMHAFNLALQQRNFHVLDLLIDLTQMMVEGELMQKEWVGCIDINEEEHSQLVRRKTACLFAACTRLGSIVSGGSNFEQPLADYGWNLGMAFQLIDDILDFTADEAVLGKPVGGDLREGKVTLPLIFALQRCTQEERESVQTVLRDGGYATASVDTIRTMVEKHNGIKDARRCALKYTDTAVAQLDRLPESDYKRALHTVSDWIVDRDR
jgi:octaprenyl-diphosphate synthase